MQNFYLDSDLLDAYSLSSLLTFIICLILLRITILTLYKLSKPQQVKKKRHFPVFEKVSSSATLIDDTETEKENLMEKLDQTNDFDEFLDTQVELEALKYKTSL